MKDYYRVLGLEFGAGLAAIKERYRQQALRYHPDRNRHAEAAQKFIEITEAYEVLIDPQKRQEYDALYRVHQQRQATTSPRHQEQHYEQEYKDKLLKWADYGRQKADEYAGISTEDFSRYLDADKFLWLNYIPNIIAIAICGFTSVAVGLVVMLAPLFVIVWAIYTNLFSSERYVTFEELLQGFFSWVLLVVFWFLPLYHVTKGLIKVAKADYAEEKKRKTTNIKI